MITTTDTLHRRLKNATLAITTLGTLMLTIIPFIRGGWIISSIVSTLWFFWMGILLSQKIALKPVFRLLFAVPFVALYIFPFHNASLCWMLYPIDFLTFHYWFYLFLRFSASFLLGWALSPKCKEENDSIESLLTLLGFIVLGVFTALACRRIILTEYTYHIEMLKILVPAIKCNIETIPLLGVLYFTYKSTMTPAVQKCMDIRWVRMACKTLCIALFCILMVSIVANMFVGSHISYDTPETFIEFLRDAICCRLGGLGCWGIICSPVFWCIIYTIYINFKNTKYGTKRDRIS